MSTNKNGYGPGASLGASMSYNNSSAKLGDSEQKAILAKT